MSSTDIFTKKTVLLGNIGNLNMSKPVKKSTIFCTACFNKNTRNKENYIFSKGIYVKMDIDYSLKYNCSKSENKYIVKPIREYEIIFLQSKKETVMKSWQL